MASSRAEQVESLSNSLLAQMSTWTTEEATSFMAKIGAQFNAQSLIQAPEQGSGPLHAQPSSNAIWNENQMFAEPNLAKSSSTSKMNFTTGAILPTSSFAFTVATPNKSPNGQEKHMRGSKAQKKERRTKKANVRNGEKQTKTKGVNAFMAFRAYFCTIFSVLEQKQRSSLVSELWAFDLFKREWTVIANAYSTIRNRVGKDNAPIKNYLDLVCPLVGIPAPLPNGYSPDYLTSFGWSLNVEAQRLSRPSAFPTRADFLIMESVTEQDLITYCQSQNYPANAPATGISSELTMTSNLKVAAPISKVTKLASFRPDPSAVTQSLTYAPLFDPEEDYSHLFEPGFDTADWNTSFALPADMSIDEAPTYFWGTF